MLKRKTTFVVGAGASFDLGFPLGDTLRDRIIELLKVDDPNRSINFSDPTLSRIMQARAVREAGANAWPDRMETYRRAAAAIRDGLPFARSIDSFMDGLRDRPEVEFLGKLAIVIVILRAEAASPLALKRVQAANATDLWEKQLRKLLSSWHSELGQILYDGHTRETLGRIFENVSFVVFNYDRCIEEYLTVSLMRRFDISRRDAEAMVAQCRIVHPYGQVGSFTANEVQTPFGNPKDQDLIEIASKIRTFTEAMEESIGDQVKEMVSQANVLVFMGFGWLPKNMELLEVGQRVTNASQVFATTMGMDKGETAVVSDQIDKILRRAEHSPAYAQDKLPPAEFIAENGDCKSLMKNCWLRLTR